MMSIDRQLQMVPGGKLMKLKIYIIGFLCYLLASMTLTGFISQSSFVVNVLVVIVSFLWWQAGLGIFKRRNRSRVMASFMFLLLSIIFLYNSYFTTILPIVDEYAYCGDGQISSPLICIFSASAFFVLTSKKMRKFFQKDATTL